MPARLSAAWPRALASVRFPVTSEPVPVAVARRVPPVLTVKALVLPMTSAVMRSRLTSTAGSRGSAAGSTSKTWGCL